MHGRDSCFLPQKQMGVLHLCVCLAVMSLWFSGAAAQRRADPVGLVPRSAVAVAKLNWNIVRDDDKFRSMLNAEQLDRALSELNIRGSQISEIVIFSGINTSPSGVVGGVFVGSFDVGSVRTALESGSYAKRNYLGRVLYWNEVDQSCTSLLKSGGLVVGSSKAVEGVIEAEMNHRTSLTVRPPFTTILRRFVASRQPISFAMALPLEYQMVGELAVKIAASLFNLSGLGPLGFVIDKIGIPQAIGFSVARKGNRFPAELIAKMKDEASAALISGTMNLAQSINLDILTNRMPESEREMLRNISVTRRSSLLSITMTLREEDLAAPRR